MTLVEQWRELQQQFPEHWSEARLALAVPDEAGRRRAAALLAPAGAARHGDELRFTAARLDGGAMPEAVRRLLARLDREGVGGELLLVRVAEGSGDGTAAHPPRHLPLAAAWDEAVKALPTDWTDVHAEVELRSSDYLERAALLMAPLNPLRDGTRVALRFRAARRFGYGASDGMTRRCLERCDHEGIVGAVGILRVLCDVDPVGTQGPVWHVGGRTV
jgi:hypothetical protein